MVDDEARVGVPIDQRGAVVEIVPAQEIDREIVPNGRVRNSPPRPWLSGRVELTGQIGSPATTALRTFSASARFSSARLPIPFALSPEMSIGVSVASIAS